MVVVVEKSGEEADDSKHTHTHIRALARALASSSRSTSSERALRAPRFLPPQPGQGLKLCLRHVNNECHRGDSVHALAAANGSAPRPTPTPLPPPSLKPVSV